MSIQRADFPEDLYIVVCRDDRISPRKAGPYVLATRQTFPTRAAAEAYRQTCARSRRPLVIAGRFHQLRIGGAQ